MQNKNKLQIKTEIQHFNPLTINVLYHIETTRVNQIYICIKVIFRTWSDIYDGTLTAKNLYLFLQKVSSQMFDRVSKYISDNF